MTFLASSCHGQRSDRMFCERIVGVVELSSFVPCRSIRGLQLSRAGKTLWNLRSYSLALIRIVYQRRAMNRFCCLPRGACKARCPFSEVATLIPAQLPTRFWSAANTAIRWSRSRCFLGINKCILWVVRWHVRRVVAEMYLERMLTRMWYLRHRPYGKLAAGLTSCWIRPWGGILQHLNSSDASKLACEDLAGSMELEWPQSGPWDWTTLGFVPDVLLWRSNYVIFFGRDGVLTLKSTTGKGLQKMLFQEDGDVLIMAGKFQAEYLHGVPSRWSWDDLMRSPGFTMLKDWEKQGMKLEVAEHNKSWTLARLCGVSGCVTSDTGGFEPASICDLTNVRVGLAVGTEGVEWHQEAFSDRKWRDDAWREDADAADQQDPQVQFLQKSQKESLQNSVSLLLDCLHGQCCERRLRIVLADIEKFAMGWCQAGTWNGAESHWTQCCVKQRQLESGSAGRGRAESGFAVICNFQALAVSAVATQLCRKIQGHFKALSVYQWMCWVKEIQQPRVQNCLKDDIAFWKLLFTHRQVEELMEAADVEQSVKYQALAVDLRNVCVQGNCHGLSNVLKGIARRRNNLLRRIMVWVNMICLGGLRCSSEALRRVSAKILKQMARMQDACFCKSNSLRKWPKRRLKSLCCLKWRMPLSQRIAFAKASVLHSSHLFQSLCRKPTRDSCGFLIQTVCTWTARMVCLSLKTIMSGFGRKVLVADVMHCGRGTLPALSGSVWLRHQGTSWMLSGLGTSPVLSGSVWLLHPALRSCRHYDRIEKVMLGKCVWGFLQQTNLWLYLALM